MFSILRNSGKTAYGQKDYIVDFESDMSSLPTNGQVGSLAFVIEKSQYYMLNHHKQWIKVTLSSGTGGGNGGDDVEEVIYNGGLI